MLQVYLLLLRLASDCGALLVFVVHALHLIELFERVPLV
jgi:hypothetical protein